MLTYLEHAWFDLSHFVSLYYRLLEEETDLSYWIDTTVDCIKYTIVEKIHLVHPSGLLPLNESARKDWHTHV